MTKEFGKHYVVDFFECDEERIKLVEPVQKVLLGAAEKSGATIVGHRFHQFDPVGVSGVILIAESHLSVHTWPEDRFAGMDIFTCGEEMDPKLAVEVVQRELGARRIEMKVMTRGKLGNSRTGPAGED